jgi:hypothetical protein
VEEVDIGVMGEISKLVIEIGVFGRMLGETYVGSRKSGTSKRGPRTVPRVTVGIVVKVLFDSPV